MAVFVLDKHKKPVNSTSEKHARKLLEQGRAVVHRTIPFTIRVKDLVREEMVIHPHRIKLDPGSKVTGFAITKKIRKETEIPVLLGELEHKTGISESLESRKSIRRNRRNRKTRYRKERRDNRKSKLTACVNCGNHTPRKAVTAKSGKVKKKTGREKFCRPCLLKAKGNRQTYKGMKTGGCIAPSLTARVTQTVNLVKKLQKLIPLSYQSVESVKFDMQKMQNPEISGVEYQQGELQGYEVREYLLEKFGRKCAYCEVMGVPLEVEHYIPKSREGKNRVSNLTLSCRPCNEAKGNLLPKEWISILEKSKKKIDKIRLKNFVEIEKQLQTPLQDAASVNTTRKVLLRELKMFGLPLETGTGAQTKMQRIQRKLSKTHYFDALCVGNNTEKIEICPILFAEVWTATGRGNRQMVRVDKYGFPLLHQDSEIYDKDGNRKGHRSRNKQCQSFQTGDIVFAHVTKGKKQGSYRGRVAIRHNGYFNIKDENTGQTVQGVSYKDCKLIQRSDGWMYSKKKIL